MKWGVWCTRGPGSIFGASEAWSKDAFGSREVFTDPVAAETRAASYRKHATVNLSYSVREIEDDGVESNR